MTSTTIIGSPRTYNNYMKTRSALDLFILSISQKSKKNKYEDNKKDNQTGIHENG